ncbi:MAG: polysaccharide pyruvyl transferase CsaB, partial [Candidatus Sericytochromatia bacterium]
SPGASPARIVLSGYYGFHNLGDEAILAAIVEQLRALDPTVQLTALSGDPAYTRARLGISAVHRLDLPGIARAFAGADCFVSGGGSLLQDVTGLGSVPYYLGLVKLAQWMGLKTMFLGQGIGPLRHASSRMMVGAVARKADVLAVRDAASRDLLARCGVEPGRIALTADPVLALSPAAPERVDALWSAIGLEAGRPVVAVAIRPWATWFERQLKAFSAVLAQQADAWGAQILLLPFHRPDDDGLHEELAYCLATRPEGHRPHVATLQAPVEPEEMLGLLGRVDLLVGMRLHALIMAATAATPALGLVYDPKVTAFCQLAGFPTVESVTALEDSERLGELLAGMWERRAETRQALEGQQREWRAKALTNAELALDLARSAHARS